MPAANPSNRPPLPRRHEPALSIVEGPAPSVVDGRSRLANRYVRPGDGAHRYQRHGPEQTLLYQLVEQHYPALVDHLTARDATLPKYVAREFDAFLKCGRLEHGFLHVRCADCHHERLVAFSCKHRGFCPSCGARRMAESAALLVNEILPHAPMRHL